MNWCAYSAYGVLKCQRGKGLLITLGIQLIDELQAQKPDLRVLLSSGYTGEKVNRETLTVRKYRFIQKPYDMNELLTIIKETFLKEYYAGYASFEEAWLRYTTA